MCATTDKARRRSQGLVEVKGIAKVVVAHGQMLLVTKIVRFLFCERSFSHAFLWQKKGQPSCSARRKPTGTGEGHAAPRRAVDRPLPSIGRSFSLPSETRSFLLPSFLFSYVTGPLENLIALGHFINALGHFINALGGALAFSVIALGSALAFSVIALLGTTIGFGDGAVKPFPGRTRVLRVSFFHKTPRVAHRRP